MKSVMTLTCLLGVEGCECARQKTSLPFSMGGVGLRSAVRTSTAACRSSWADTFSLIRIHHPTVADDVVITLSANLGGFRLQGANICRRRLQDAGLDAPKWGDLSRGLLLGQRGLDEAPEPGAPRHGWQRRKKMLPFSGRLYHVHKVDQWLDSFSPAATVRCPALPGSFLAAPLVPNFFCPVQVACVAVHSICVAITVQLVLWLWFWSQRVLLECQNS